MPVTHYRELVAWQKAIDLVECAYRLSAKFPSSENYGLTSQVRRAAVSIPSNIAEGQGRGAGNAFAYHLRVANGSRQETETQILIARRLGYLNDTDVTAFLELSAEVGRIVNGLIQSVCEH